MMHFLKLERSVWELERFGMSEFKKTIFLSGTYGQYKAWRNVMAPACNLADEVIQLGNTISCSNNLKDRENQGPNEAILKYLMLYRATEHNWVQLVGTNEIAAFNFPEEWTNATSRKMLRDGWFSKEPTMVTAAVNKGRLVTHGGLTFGEWIEIGKPDTAEEAAARLNEKYAATIYQGPSYKLGNSPNFYANPIWADPLIETYPSWVTAPIEMPFDQVHGSTTANNRFARQLIGDKTSILNHLDSVRYPRYGSRVYVKGREFLGINIEYPDKLVDSLPNSQSIYIEKTRIQQT